MATRLLEPNISIVATQRFDGHMLRAVVRENPGGSPEMFLERIDYGDEAEPFALVRQTKVDELNATVVDTLTWVEGGVEILADSEYKARTYFVRATSDAFESKVHRRS